MIIVAAIFSILGFMWGLHITGIVPVAKGVGPVLRRVNACVRDPECDDEVKEKELQRGSIQLFKIFLSLLVRSIITLAIATVPILLLSLIGLVEFNAVLEFLARWDVIVVVTIVIIVGVIVIRRVQHRRKTP